MTRGGLNPHLQLSHVFPGEVDYVCSSIELFRVGWNLQIVAAHVDLALLGLAYNLRSFGVP